MMQPTRLTFALLGAIALSPLLNAAPAANPSEALQLARQLDKAFADVSESAIQSVVVIKVAQDEDAVPEIGEDENPFFEYFRKQLEEERKQRRAPRADGEIPLNGRGSGIIIRKNGYIMTNRHVVQDARRIKVQLKDGREFDAELSGSDALADIAVIKIKDASATNLPVANLGDSSKARVGQYAIAIGTPYDLDYTVTVGHISAKGRSQLIRDRSVDQDFIQTDANINPGNSGGPLLNIDGEVVGINTMIRGLNTGIGFAVPINMAREIADQIVETGKFARPQLGISIRALRDFPEMQSLAGNVHEGVVILDIADPNGAAAKSELKPSDIIVAIDGHAVTTAQELKNEIRTKTIGKPVKIDVIRNMKPMQVQVAPQAWNTTPAPPTARNREATRERNNALGVRVKPLTKALAEELGLDAIEGMVVSNVPAGSPAGRAGLQPGDVITTIEGKPSANLAQFLSALEQASDPAHGIKVEFVRDGERKTSIIRVPSAK
ncbi:MAG TPA: trypsin-like peptidase domain-containing protein [Roseimicrobium sp.]|nr:trypsin-like peptidase domain-containing protein [Roseimicrobium sp.]